MTTPREVLDKVARFHRESSRRLYLVPSENVMSLAARAPLITEAAFRYSFPMDGGNPAWPGRDVLAELEADAAETLRGLYGADHVNLKPISGLNCMGLAVSALAERGTTVLSIAEADGGHGATRVIADRLGLEWRPLPFDTELFAVDSERLANELPPGPLLVYLDQFMCLFPHDLAAIRSAVGPEAVIHYDGSHVMGLIAGGEFQNPLAEGADSLGGSTHKTLPGPHKGILLTCSDQLAKQFDEHAAHWVSHHHPSDVAALAIAAAELAQDGRGYARRTVENARRLGTELSRRGLRVCAAERGYTASHQLWLDVAPQIEPEEAARRLLAAGIVVNAIPVPYLPSGTGLRLGVQEASARGMGLDEMDALADAFARLLLAREEPDRVAPEISRLLDLHARTGEEEAIDSVLMTAKRLQTSR